MRVTQMDRLIADSLQFTLVAEGMSADYRRVELMRLVNRAIWR